MKLNVPCRLLGGFLPLLFNIPDYKTTLDQEGEWNLGGHVPDLTTQQKVEESLEGLAALAASKHAINLADVQLVPCYFVLLMQVRHLDQPLRMRIVHGRTLQPASTHMLSHVGVPGPDSLGRDLNARSESTSCTAQLRMATTGCADALAVGPGGSEPCRHGSGSGTNAWSVARHGRCARLCACGGGLQRYH
jgi:hypothetical protein